MILTIMKFAFFLGTLLLCRCLDGVPILKIDEQPKDYDYPAPLSYELTLNKIDLDKKTFEGKLIFTFTTINNDVAFKLDTKNMSIDSLTEIKLTEWDCNEDKELCKNYCLDFEMRDFCLPYICEESHDSRCDDYCRINVEIETCQNKLCKNDIRDPLCKIDEFCKDAANPTECRGVCEKNAPNIGTLCDLCINSPTDNICGDSYCKTHSNEAGCQDKLCKDKIDDVLCNVEEFCKDAANPTECKGVCEKNAPNIGKLCDLCITSPTDNICGESYCLTHSNEAGCQEICKNKIDDKLCNVEEFCKDAANPTECRGVCEKNAPNIGKLCDLCSTKPTDNICGESYCLTHSNEAGCQEICKNKIDDVLCNVEEFCKDAANPTECSGVCEKNAPNIGKLCDLCTTKPTDNICGESYCLTHSNEAGCQEICKNKIDDVLCNVEEFCKDAANPTECSGVCEKNAPNIGKLCDLCSTKPTDNICGDSYCQTHSNEAGCEEICKNKIDDALCNVEEFCKDAANPTECRGVCEKNAPNIGKLCDLCSTKPTDNICGESYCLTHSNEAGCQEICKNKIDDVLCNVEEFCKDAANPTECRGVCEKNAPNIGKLCDLCSTKPTDNICGESYCLTHSNEAGCQEICKNKIDDVLCNVEEFCKDAANPTECSGVCEKNAPNIGKLCDLCSTKPTDNICGDSYCQTHGDEAGCQEICKKQIDDALCNVEEFCKDAANPTECSGVCEKNAPNIGKLCDLCSTKPTDNICGDSYCQTHGDEAGCQEICKKQIDDALCNVEEFCKDAANPTECRGVCEKNAPNIGTLCDLCINSPTDNICGDSYCQTHGDEAGCQDKLCKDKIDDVLCNVEEFCKDAANPTECKGVCEKNAPNIGTLCDLCINSPTDNICGDSYCQTHGDEAGCQEICKTKIEDVLCNVEEFCKDQTTHAEECRNVCNNNEITDIKNKDICECLEDENTDDIRCIEATDLISRKKRSIESTINGAQIGDNIIFTKIDNFDSKKVYQITITYKGWLQTSGMKGFYWSEDIDEIPLACTQFQPLDASYAYPCADLPDLKAKFQLTVNLDDTDLGTPLTNYTVISNMNLDGEPEKDSRIFKFKPTPPISSYLTAWVVSKFDALTDKNIEKFTVYTTTSQKAKGAEALKFASYAIQEMNQITKVDYFNDMKMDKLDQVALPDFSAGAMENWGLVTYRERRLLWDPEMLTSSALLSIYTVISHELAHQWFGDYVSPIAWTQLWLNEGFATYFAYFLTEKILNSDKYNENLLFEQQFVADSVRSAFEIDAQKTARSMTIQNLPTNPVDIFDSVSYDKAGSVLYMIRNILGEEKFHNALTIYLKKNANGIGEENDLFEQFTLQNAEVTKEFLTSWTNQAGYPLVTSMRNNAKLSIKQERFLNIKDEADKKTWSFPIALKTKSGFEEKKILPKLKEQEVDIPEKFEEADWYLINDKQHGYYRVNYDLDNWKKLSTQLQEDNEKIDVLTRIQLVDDVMKFAVKGDLEFDIALDLINYLKNEKQYGPWIVAINQLDNLFKKLEKGSPLKSLFGTHLLSLVDNIYKEKGFANKEGDNLLNKIFRNKIVNWACSLGNSECEASAKALFETYFAEDSDKSKLDGDHRYVVLCTGIRNGNSSDWDKVWDLTQSSESSAETTSLYQPLGCSKESEVLIKYLGSTLPTETKAADDKKIRDQDLASVYSAVYTNPEGLIPAITFISDNWDAFSERTKGMSIKRNILRGIASQIKTDDEKTSFEPLLIKIKTENEEWYNSFENIITTNLNWSKDRLPKLTDWINNNLVNAAHDVVGLPLLLLLFIASVNYFLNK